MRSIPWKLFTALFISLFPFLQSSQACAWDPSWDSGFYRFMEPEMLPELDEYRAFHFDWALLYDDRGAEPASRRAANLKDWSGYFGGSFSEQDISQAIYSVSTENLLACAQGQSPAGEIAGNKLLRAISQGKFRAFSDYLLLARDCEKYNYQANYWDESPSLPESDHELVQQLRQGFDNSSDNFLKWRYAFQVVRLLHYGGFWNDAQQAYEEMVQQLPQDKGLIYYWTLSQYAGILHGLNDRITSAYHFSQVFANCPSLRVPAWYSFDISSQDEWNRVEQLCQSPDERANLYFMRAIVPDAVAAEEIRAIQEVAPGSPQADLLLVREINKLEEKLLGYPYGGWKEDESIAGASAGTLGHIGKWLDLVQETRRSGEMANPSLWGTAEAYLEHLSGNTGRARDILAKMPKKGKEGAKVRLLDLTMKIQSAKKVDAKVENDILKDFYNLKDLLSPEQVEELALYRDDRFARAYDQQKEPGKALLARKQTYDLYYSPKVEVLNDLMAFQEKSNKTLYEKELLQRLESEFSKPDLLEMKGTVLMSKNLLPEAVKVFAQLPEEYVNGHRFYNIGPDPFAANLRDFINCEPGCHVDKYNKRSLARMMIGLQEKALEDPEKAGEYNLLLGNAYFNLSYYGACWKGLAYYRGYSWQSEQDQDPTDPQLALALKYYEKAMQSSRKREIAALACMMAAKCEVVETFGPLPDGFKYYDRMMADYSDTDLYRQAIRECKYFTFYSQR